MAFGGDEDKSRFAHCPFIPASSQPESVKGGERISVPLPALFPKAKRHSKPSKVSAKQSEAKEPLTHSLGPIAQPPFTAIPSKITQHSPRPSTPQNSPPRTLCRPSAPQPPAPSRATSGTISSRHREPSEPFERRDDGSTGRPAVQLAVCRR